MNKKLFAICAVFLAILPQNATASVDPYHGFQETWHFDTLANAAAKVGLYKGYS